MITQIKDKITQILKKDFIVGLDIGTSSIKLAQFIKKEDGLYLIKLGLVELANFENLLGSIDIKKSKFIVGINCPKTAVRKVTLPYMPKQDLQEAIRLAARNYFPFSIEDALLDFKIERELTEKGVKKYEVIVATSPKNTINGCLAGLEKVNIKPAALMPVQAALQELTKLSYSQDKTTCFVDIGSTYTELVISKGKNIIFSRKIPIAGSNFTQAMTGVLVSDMGRVELSLVEAEKIKCRVGIPKEGESRIIDAKISTPQILSMLRSPLEQLTSEIERCFDYYREQAQGATRIDSLELFGQGALLNGLPEFLGERLGIEVKPGNPLEGLKVEPGVKTYVEKIGSSSPFAVAIGLALSNAEGINLLPLEIKEEKKRIFKRTIIENAVIATILILIFIYAGIKIQLNNFQKRISVAGMELSSLGPQLQEARPQILINKILCSEPYWEDAFKELSNIILDDIYLTELSMQNKTLKMCGVVVSQNPESFLSKFSAALENGIFKEVKLISTKETKAGREFELDCRLD